MKVFLTFYIFLIVTIFYIFLYSSCCISSFPREDSAKKRVLNLTACDEFYITVRSLTLSEEELETVVKTWENEYQSSISPNKYLRYYVLESNMASEVKPKYYETNQNRYIEYLLQPHITFHKLDFRGKEEIMNLLEFFVSRKEWYIHKRIPHNIGFFLHGQPSSGCERTSTIKGNSNIGS